jgi:hypothetical protein
LLEQGHSPDIAGQFFVFVRRRPYREMQRLRRSLRPFCAIKENGRGYFNQTRRTDFARVNGRRKIFGAARELRNAGRGKIFRIPTARPPRGSSPARRRG